MFHPKSNPLHTHSRVMAAKSLCKDASILGLLPRRVGWIPASIIHEDPVPAVCHYPKFDPHQQLSSTSTIALCAATLPLVCYLKLQWCQWFTVPAGCQLSEVLQICQGSFSAVVTINLGVTINTAPGRDRRLSFQHWSRHTWCQACKVMLWTGTVLKGSLERSKRKTKGTLPLAPFFAECSHSLCRWARDVLEAVRKERLEQNWSQKFRSGKKSALPSCLPVICSVCDAKEKNGSLNRPSSASHCPPCTETAQCQKRRPSPPVVEFRIAKHSSWACTPHFKNDRGHGSLHWGLWVCIEVNGCGMSSVEASRTERSRVWRHLSEKIGHQGSVNPRRLR